MPEDPCCIKGQLAPAVRQVGGGAQGQVQGLSPAGATLQTVPAAGEAEGKSCQQWVGIPFVGRVRIQASRSSIGAMANQHGRQWQNHTSRGGPGAHSME